MKRCLILFFFSVSKLLAQDADLISKAKIYTEKNYESWGLTKTDVEDLKLSDFSRSNHNGISHLYFKQRYKGIDVFKGILGIHLNSSGDVVYSTSNCIPNLEEKVNALEPVVTPKQALVNAIDFLNLKLIGPVLQVAQNENTFIFEAPGVSAEPVTVFPIYCLTLHSNELKLTWNIDLKVLNSPDYFSLRVDAIQGFVIDKQNYTTYCSFPGKSLQNLDAFCRDEVTFSNYANTFSTNTFDAFNSEQPTYHVFPFPVESPIHGERELAINPSDPMASPFGWHDVDGVPGAEYTITKGNNVHAFLDIDAENVSKNDEPQGDSTLIFDFPFNPDAEPDKNKNAAVVQLFYANNFLHDFAYHYGFDQAAGNFQQNTYGDSGFGNDAIMANVRDGSGTNNANFSAPPDGQNGTMQMFIWDVGGVGLLEGVSPIELATRFETQSADFGPRIDENPIEGLVVEALDGTDIPDRACEEIVNKNEVKGRIAMINRGECFFELKVKNAEEAGAIAVIICNSEPSLVQGPMAGTADIVDPAIPSVMLKSSDCQRIRLYLKSGVKVRFQLPLQSGPKELDASFDNGIIAHEYGHGISIRLTGGPSDASCLFNDEQMGEGWSDFFALVLTSKPAFENGNQIRGIGNYVIKGGIKGGGIRRVPYSTDPSINRQTYDDIINTFGPHDLGEIWAATLWDLYWKFIEVYGWDPDLFYGNGGNNMAIQLVIDGLKLQECEPGFIDGRNAIIAADLINYGGANECLIWEVFSNRGLGWSAEEGRSSDRNDGRPGFDLPPSCSNSLLVDKQVDELIEPGDDIRVNLKISNFSGQLATGVLVTDLIPPGTSFIPGSLESFESATFELVNDQLLFNIVDLQPDQEVNIQYMLSTDSEIASERKMLDDAESGNQLWEIIDLEEGNSNNWEIKIGPSISGVRHWFIATDEFINDKALQTKNPILINGEQPVLRFYHKYVTEAKNDGGIVQVSTDGGITWKQVDDLIFRNPYRGLMTFSTFVIPNINGFWGRNASYKASYIDLSPFIGKEVLIRFRFGTLNQAGFGNDQGQGWSVDDIEIMEMKNYNAEVCIQANGILKSCTLPIEKGTIIESREFTVTATDHVAQNRGMSLAVFPNPVGGVNKLLNVSVGKENNGAMLVDLFDADGKRVLRQSTSVNSGQNLLQLDVSNLPNGFYALKINSGKDFLVQKIIIE